MSFDWSNYLHLAHDLARSGATHVSREAESRSAISRAYYAAFCKSRNHLRDIDYESLPAGPEVHTEVQIRFISSKDKRRVEMGQNLVRLRRLRNKADYDDRFSNLARETAIALNIAEDIISDLRRL